jgi:pilus assembly protein CpaB
MQSRVLATLVAVVLALVATAALVVYVNGADRRAISDQQPVRVWVAVKPIPAGTNALTARNTHLIDLVEMPQKNVANGVVRSLSQIENKVAAVNIVPEEQLLLSRWVGFDELRGRGLLPIPEKHQAVSIGVELTRQVAGFVTPGDKVSLVASLNFEREGQGSGKDIETSQFLLQNVQVLAVGTTALSNASAQGSGGRVNQGKGSQTLTAVTLAIDEKDVPRVVFAAEYGSIYLTLMPPNAKDANVPGVTGANVIPPPDEQ